MHSDILMRKENYGVTYERFSLAMFIGGLARLYNIKTVLDVSGNGFKGIKGINSLEFARQHCQVYVLGAPAESATVWSGLGLIERVTFVQNSNLLRLPFDDNVFDLAWNLKGLPKLDDPFAAVKEMARVSRDLVLVVCLNGGALNFAIHRLAHRARAVAWDHGDIRYMHPGKILDLYHRCGIKVLQWGVIDAPPWPGSLGLKDIRYHIDSEKGINWHSRYLDYLREKRFPLWLWGSYVFERVPLPRRVKLAYAHIFYVLGRKVLN